MFPRPEIAIDLSFRAAAGRGFGVSKGHKSRGPVKIEVEFCQLHKALRVLWAHLSDSAKRNHHRIVVRLQHVIYMVDIGNLSEEGGLGTIAQARQARRRDLYMEVAGVTPNILLTLHEKRRCFNRFLDGRRN